MRIGLPGAIGSDLFRTAVILTTRHDRDWSLGGIRAPPHCKTGRLTSGRPLGRHRSVVAAEDAGEFALDADLGGGVALGVVGSVCRVEADHGAFAAEVF